MTINEHMTEIASKPVEDWDAETGIEDATGTIYRISLYYEETEDGIIWTDKFAEFMSDPNASKITGIVVGCWGDISVPDTSAPVVEAIVSACDRLPDLKAIF